MDDPPTPDPTSPCTPFSSDHRQLDDLLGGVLQMLEASACEAAAGAWTKFRDCLARHMHAEETLVIPAVTRMDPREVRVLLEEHRHLRRRSAELTAKIERGGARPAAVRAFADELRAHASHEARTLYAWAETELDSAKMELALASLGRSPPPEAQERDDHFP